MISQKRSWILAGLLTFMFSILPISFAGLDAWALDDDDDHFPKSGLSLGGRAAYYEPDEADDGEFFGGAQLRLYLSRAIALEGSIDYRRNDFGATRIDTFPVQASLLAYILPGMPVNPFLLGGVGWYYTNIEGPGGFDDTQHRFGVHAGGGLQLFINPYWSIDGTYRFIWLEKIESRDASLLDKDFDDNGHMITAALNFHFP
jgi:opacity protein-like surface antigen